MFRNALEKSLFDQDGRMKPYFSYLIIVPLIMDLRVTRLLEPNTHEWWGASVFDLYMFSHRNASLHIYIVCVFSLLFFRWVSWPDCRVCGIRQDGSASYWCHRKLNPSFEKGWHETLSFGQPKASSSCSCWVELIISYYQAASPSYNIKLYFWNDAVLEEIWWL